MALACCKGMRTRTEYSWSSVVLVAREPKVRTADQGLMWYSKASEKCSYMLE
jgi:hypothetical protein